MKEKTEKFTVVFKVFNNCGIQVKKVVKEFPPSMCLDSLMHEAENLRSAKDDTLLRCETLIEMKL